MDYTETPSVEEGRDRAGERWITKKERKKKGGGEKEVQERRKGMLVQTERKKHMGRKIKNVNMERRNEGRKNLVMEVGKKNVEDKRAGKERNMDERKTKGRKWKWKKERSNRKE